MKLHGVELTQAQTKHNAYVYKKGIGSAERKGEDRFIIEGHEVLVAYAKYVYEYLTGKKYAAIPKTERKESS